MPSQPLTAGRQYDISCRVWGSNPPARIEWYRGTSQDMRPISALNETYLEGGNVTLSFVRLMPTPKFHQQTLTCRGSNEVMMTPSTKVVEDYHRLQVFCEYSPIHECSETSLGFTTITMHHQFSNFIEMPAIYGREGREGDLRKVPKSK